MRRFIALFLTMGLFAASVIAEARDLRTEQVRFKPGQTGTSIAGKIVGYESISYLLGAEAGQVMTVTLKPSNLATYFNVYAPGSGPGDQALATGDRAGPMSPKLNMFKGKLPASGQYTISVYMMRSAARRNERSNYTLNVSVSPLENAAARPPVRNDYADGLQGGPDYWEVKTSSPAGKINLRASPSAAGPVFGSLSGGAVLRNLGCRMAEGRRRRRVETVKAPRLTGWAAGEFLRESAYTGAPVPSHDALVPGTNFHATGNIPCARYGGQPMNSCEFGVVRRGPGNGSVTIFWRDGGSRVIDFANGSPANFDRSSADGDVQMTVTRNADLFTITIGAQRFEVPESVIMGG